MPIDFFDELTVGELVLLKVLRSSASVKELRCFGAGFSLSRVKTRFDGLSGWACKDLSIQLGSTRIFLGDRGL